MHWQPATKWSILATLLLAIILVPFFIYEHAINAAVEQFIAAEESTSAIATAIAALLASDVILPVPSSLVATASGYLLGLPFGAFVTWLGMNAGAAIGYWLGSAPGRLVARRFVGDKELQRAADAYAAWGPWSLIVARAVPVLAEASVVFAGTVRMPRMRFAFLIGLANAAIALVYAAVGAFALNTESFLLAVAASIAIPGIAMLLTKKRRWPSTP